MISTFSDKIEERVQGASKRLRSLEGSIADIAAFRALGGSKMRIISRGAGIAHVECPGCHLSVEQDMLVDVSAVPSELSHGQNWVCTGCLDRWYRERRTLGSQVVTRADIHEAIGGDPIDRSHGYWGRPALTRRQVLGRNI